MSAQLRVKGHTLPQEGRIYSLGYGFTPKGRARCSCGWQSSEVLESDGARKRAHREHKLEVRDGRA